MLSKNGPQQNVATSSMIFTLWTWQVALACFEFDEDERWKSENSGCLT